MTLFIVQIAEHLLCLVFFCLLLDVGKIGILINKRYIMYYFNFYLSKDFLLFDDVFLLQAKKIRV